MDRGWYLRFAVVVILTALSVYLLYPSYFFYVRATPEQRDSHEQFCAAMPSWLHCKKFNLGLDLQGGVHLVMGVRVDKAVEQRADRLADALRDGLKEAKLAFVRIDRPRDSADVVLTLAPETDAKAVEKYVRTDFSVLRVARRSGAVLTLALQDSEAEHIRNMAVEQAIKTIRNRADRLGVTEPTIARRGGESVLIQLPGVKDPDRAIDLIGRTAQLQFTMVDEAGTAVFDDIKEQDLPAGVTKHDYTFDGPGGKPVREVYFQFSLAQKEALLALLEPKIESNRTLGLGLVRSEGEAAPAGKEELYRTYLLEARPGITGDYLTHAQVQQDPQIPSDYYVTMEFDAKGAKIFEKLTQDNVKRHMAIVLDGKVNSAPVIQEKIGGGTARITLGGGDDARAKFQEATDLALVLKAGALPAPVEIREKRQVGKSLGMDSVKKGATACIIGTLLVIIFMAMYYRGSGMIANIALLLYVVMMLAVLALFEATLTLPGLAGFALTVGMAVDANVIIFERIREELRLGKTPRAAIEAGYSKASATVVDPNMTTIIAGVVLMQYGTGPVRGFAVTLIVGNLCAMFTAVVVTRLIYDYFTSRRHVKALSI